MPSVIIAAHNERSVIGDCLDALAGQVTSEPLEVIVSANGCTDDTAARAREHGALVIERAEPGKSAALNAAEEMATSLPRIYLDADIIAPPESIQALVDRVTCGGALAAVPARRLDVEGRPWPVRAYYSINERLPAFRSGLFGRGMICLSGDARGRFERFPEMIADDLFLDSQFSDDEKSEVQEVVVVVEAPYSTRELLARLVRVRKGNAQMRAAAREGGIELTVRPADRWAWLRDVVARKPSLALAAVPYLIITVVAALRARRASTTEWGRDESSRTKRADEGAS